MAPVLDVPANLKRYEPSAEAFTVVERAPEVHLMRAVPVSGGRQERVRDELTASERAFPVAEKGREEIHFRWRPGRGVQSVWASMSFDAPSENAVLDVRDEEGLLGVAGLGKGSSFAAVCQIARAAGLEAGSARG